MAPLDLRPSLTPNIHLLWSINTRHIKVSADQYIADLSLELTDVPYFLSWPLINRGLNRVDRWPIAGSCHVSLSKTEPGCSAG